MSRKKLLKEKKASGGAPGWTVTFSDMMSLLLTFFILLYSMSNVDAEKFSNVTSSIQNILSNTGGDSIIDEGKIDPITMEELKKLDESLASGENGNLPEGIEQMYSQVDSYIGEKDLDADIEVNANKRGVFVDIKGAILFESGSDRLKPRGIELLESLEELIVSIDNEIIIEGHTDDVPTNSTVYPTNWELSTARAVTVVRHLNETTSIDPSRLSAMGYGEYNPLLPNDSVENRAANRRVNILIVFDEWSE